MQWFGFWIFLAVLVACDYWVFSQGYNGILLEHKTEQEKEIQRLKIAKLKKEVESTDESSR
jgi:hypothetical protein